MQFLRDCIFLAESEVSFVRLFILDFCYSAFLSNSKLRFFHNSQTWNFNKAFHFQG